MPCKMERLVLTSIAAEGMFGDIEANGFVADNPHEFAQLAIELYKNSDLWKTKQQNGFQVINKRFGKSDFYKNLELAIKEITQQLHTKRLNNFTGQMLMHHTLQSTKFMGKWIEEKNKKTNVL